MSAAQIGADPVVEFHRVNFRSGRQQPFGQRTESGADFQHRFAGFRRGLTHDIVKQIAVEQEILSQSPPRTHPEARQLFQQIAFIHRDRTLPRPATPDPPHRYSARRRRTAKPPAIPRFCAAEYP
ncbi:hypothetical protein SDC9_184736 [bioreactor metagenome]|uniref:Uncharacterized protein n=1 Tax=bioreactor metagenome TaxID=1076179 RepID=A0A645HER0_9ZZZZ